MLFVYNSDESRVLNKKHEYGNILQLLPLHHRPSVSSKFLTTLSRAVSTSIGRKESRPAITAIHSQLDLCKLRSQQAPRRDAKAHSHFCAPPHECCTPPAPHLECPHFRRDNKPQMPVLMAGLYRVASVRSSAHHLRDFLFLIAGETEFVPHCR